MMTKYSFILFIFILYTSAQRELMHCTKPLCDSGFDHTNDVEVIGDYVVSFGVVGKINYLQYADSSLQDGGCTLINLHEKIPYLVAVVQMKPVENANFPFGVLLSVVTVDFDSVSEYRIVYIDFSNEKTNGVTVYRGVENAEHISMSTMVVSGDSVYFWGYNNVGDRKLYHLESNYENFQIAVYGDGPDCYNSSNHASLQSIGDATFLECKPSEIYRINGSGLHRLPLPYLPSVVVNNKYFVIKENSSYDLYDIHSTANIAVPAYSIPFNSTGDTLYSAFKTCPMDKNCFFVVISDNTNTIHHHYYTFEGGNYTDYEMDLSSINILGFQDLLGAALGFIDDWVILQTFEGNICTLYATNGTATKEITYNGTGGFRSNKDIHSKLFIPIPNTQKAIIRLTHPQFGLELFILDLETSSLAFYYDLYYGEGSSNPAFSYSFDNYGNPNFYHANGQYFYVARSLFEGIRVWYLEESSCDSNDNVTYCDGNCNLGNNGTYVGDVVDVEVDVPADYEIVIIGDIQNSDTTLSGDLTVIGSLNTTDLNIVLGGGNLNISQCISAENIDVDLGDTSQINPGEEYTLVTFGCNAGINFNIENYTIGCEVFIPNTTITSTSASVIFNVVNACETESPSYLLLIIVIAAIFGLVFIIIVVVMGVKPIRQAIFPNRTNTQFDERSEAELEYLEKRLTEVDNEIASVTRRVERVDKMMNSIDQS